MEATTSSTPTNPLPHESIYPIRDALSVLCEEGQTVEIRAKGRGGSIYSGYGHDMDEIARQVEVLDTADTEGIYLTINPVNPALMARRSKIKKTRTGEPLTSDVDIIQRRWLPIDLDPTRPAGVSSTVEEKAAALKKAGLVIAYLTGLGWPAPLVGDSGNGYHILYRVDLPNDEVSRDLVKGCLESLSTKFSDTSVSVDTKNFNAARIWKLYGTFARKGENAADRPHRRAALISAPDSVEVVGRELLEQLAHETTITQSTFPSQSKGKGKKFDLAEWVDEHESNLPFKVIPKNKEGYRYFYLLDPCPFSGGTHNDGAFLGQSLDGAVFARCHHNSCGNENRWRELRIMVEPGYVEQKTSKKSEQHNDIIGAKEEETGRILSFFEKKGCLYLDVIEPSGIFGFAYEDGDQIRVESVVYHDGDSIKPVVLPMHHDSRETVFVVGVPRADLLRSAELLSPIDLYNLLDDHINRYCDMPERDRELVVYYALYTWFYIKAPTSPYLRFIGDTGKGKSRLTEVISDLCLYPIKATGSSTTSGIMRFHERWRGTLVIDEGDLRGGADDPLVKFLNIGFENGKFIILSDTNDPSRQLIFKPYGPKVLAMRVPFKDNATEGRCLSYSPYETLRKDIPPELSTTYHTAVAKIRAIIARFVLHNWQNVDGDRMMDYGDIDIERRLLQMARPISIILQLFPDGQSRFIEYLKARQQEIKRTRAESWEGSLFNYAYAFAIGDEAVDCVIPEAVTARDIAEVFKTNPKAVTKALQSIGFETETDHINVKNKEGSSVRKTIKKLVVPSIQEWREITRRYWFSDEGSTPPSCPDILKGKRWIDPQTRLGAPLSTSVPSVPSMPARDQVTGIHGTHGTEEERGGSDQLTLKTELPKISNNEILHDAGVSTLPDIAKYARIHHPDTIIGRCMWKECTDNPIWGEGGNVKNPLCDRHYHIIKNSAVSSSPEGPFARLLQEYGLPPDTRLSNHVLVYQPDSHCIVHGCSKEPQLRDITSENRSHPFCREHFDLLRNAMKQEQDYVSTL